MITLSPVELALDVPKLLGETEQAMAVIIQQGVDVPPEATEMLSLLRRCVVAEEKLKAGAIAAEPAGRVVIEIPKSPTADTRTCDVSQVTKDQLYRSSHQHILDVRRGLLFFRYLLDDAAARHDFDKLSDIDSFFADFQTKFTLTAWWDRHRKLNRHHLLQADGVPADVNLIDVLDMIADCTMAGMARAGSVYPLQLSNELLQAAFRNTCELLLSHVRVCSEK